MLEILLVIAAWRRGWKGWALFPSVIGYSLMFLFVGLGDGSDPSGLLVLIAAGVIGALIYMVARPRTPDAYPSSKSTSLPPDPSR